MNDVFRDGSKLVHVTSESPRQFGGVVFLVYEGETPETVGESLRTVAQLKGLQRVEVSTLSVQWKNALQLPEDSPSKSESNHPADSIITVQPDEAPSPVIMKLSPGWGWLCLNFFIGMSVLVTMQPGEPNWWFLMLMLVFSAIAVIYGVGATLVLQSLKD